MTKQEFILQYVLSRTSHKKTAEELFNEACYIWDKAYT